MEDDLKYELYDESVRYSHKFGYRQESFVSFTNLSSDCYKQQVSDFEGNPLIGIGVGVRSYNNSIHYSTDYAVTQITTFNIIMDYINKGFEKSVQYDFRMDEEEQKRSQRSFPESGCTDTRSCSFHCHTFSSCIHHVSEVCHGAPI